MGIWERRLWAKRAQELLAIPVNASLLYILDRSYKVVDTAIRRHPKRRRGREAAAKAIFDRESH